MKTSPQLIAFDLFGVVISEGHMVSNALMPLLPPRTEKKRVKHHYQRYTLGQISEDEFWQAIGQANYHELRETFLHSFALDPDFMAVADVLKEHYPLAMLSNLATDWGAMLIEKFGFEEIFSPIIISGEVRCGKPDPAIYKALLDQSGVAGENITFIDDRLENLAIASHFAMQTIHYRREPDDHLYQADYVITQMNEMTSIF